MLRLNPLFPSLSFWRTRTMPIPRQSLFCKVAKANIQSLSSKATKKQRRELPENVLRFKLDMCSSGGTLTEALRLYEEARRSGLKLLLHHYNVLFYLCSRRSSSIECGNVDGANDLKNPSIQKGFEIFREMVADKVSPNEATFTSLARLAAAAEDPEMAFDLVKQMKSHGIPPKLRSYGPALFGFCEKGDADKSFEVDGHMAECRVALQEPELSALLKVSIVNERIDKVYELLHRLRATVRQVSESTFQVIEDWFKFNQASKVGSESWDVNKVKEGVAKGGGGWHGQGWLGSGSWTVVRTQVNENGLCLSCGEKLVCIDIDPKETESFASKLNSLACEREAKADFLWFQEWLKQNGPFDAVVDGANVGLVNNQQFNFSQLKNVVYRLHQISPSKRLPLVILHQSRVTGGPAKIHNNRILLDGWNKSGALYATPAGCNDDWYWLYAAVSCNCLLVTNDEMRDHLFQLLGDSFFPRWKEKHQVRLSVSRAGLNLLMPPPYSTIIQESEHGSWHVPKIMGDNDVEGPRQWLCASRADHRFMTEQKQCLRTGLEDALVNYIFGRKKATEVAHIVWRNVVQKGDTVVDATCGNGYDTLAMLKMIADDSGKGRVYGFDIQPESIVSTSFLLDSTLNQEVKQQVQLFNISHSKMDEVVPSDTAVRLVAFNLGYLPGGDKRIITMSETTVLALEAATELLMSGGMISLVVYIGHLGGREELEAIEAFASRLRVDRWTCCKVQALNRPLAPVLIFMLKR